jgi:F-type H+-transporting ATPase subunit delta
VVGRIAEKLGLSRVARNFLFVLVDKRRIASLTQIIQSFEQVVDERLGFARADISSARELTEPQRSALNARLEQLTGRRIRAHYSVDGSLIGGIVARIGSTVYDGSVRGQLASLERRLEAES